VHGLGGIIYLFFPDSTSGAIDGIFSPYHYFPFLQIVFQKGMRGSEISLLLPSYAYSIILQLLFLLHISTSLLYMHGIMRGRCYLKG